jgi:hypothetical protein
MKTKGRSNRANVAYKFATGATNQTQTAQCFVEEILNIHTALEDIISLDGWKPNVKNIIFHVRAFNLDTAGMPIWVQPVLVQTAGTITDVADQAGVAITTWLNNAINDVFAFIAGPIQHGKPVPNVQGTKQMEVVDFKFNIPQHLVTLLTREIETERLQDLHFVLVGYTPYLNSTHLQWCVGMETRFEAVKAGIATIR